MRPPTHNTAGILATTPLLPSHQPVPHPIIAQFASTTIFQCRSDPAACTRTISFPFFQSCWGGGEGDEEDNECEPEGEDDAKIPWRYRHSQAAWLIRAFKAIVGECEKCTDGLPILYALYHTFWTSRKSTYFRFPHTNVTPINLFHSCGTRSACTRTFVAHVATPPYICTASFPAGGVLESTCRSRSGSSGIVYCCPQCKHPKTGKATVTWRS